MQHGDRKAFGTLLADAMAFYGQELSVFAIEVWWQACAKFSFEQVSKAFTRHAMDPERGQFAPRPADIIRMLDGTATDRAMMAWGKLHDAMGRVGAYTDVVFDDPAIHAAVDDMGGWPKLCRTELSELSYLQHRFTETYRAYVGRGEAFAYPRRLVGDRAPDDVYAMRGLPPPKPAVIGDLVRAREVYRLGGTRGKSSAVMHQALEAVEAGPKLIADQQQRAA